MSVSTASDGIVDFMWGPDGWSRKVGLQVQYLFVDIFQHLLDQVPAWQFTAKFKDQDQDTVISFDKVRCLSKRHFYQHQ